MAIRQIVTVPTTQAYSASQSWTQDLSNLPGTITRIDFELEANVTTGVTPGTTQDWIYRLLSSLSLTSNLGSHISLNDLRPVHFHNKKQWDDVVVPPNAPGASAANAVRKALLRVDFGVNPLDPFDLSAGIPSAPRVSNLALSGTWAAASALGSGYTINAGTLLRTKLYLVIPEMTDHSDALPKALPVFQTYKSQPSSATPSLGYTFDVPLGHFWRDILVMVAAGAPPADNRSSSAVSEVGILVPQQANGQRYKATMQEFSEEYRTTAVADDDGTTFGQATIAAGPDVGVGYWDLARLAAGGNPLYGLDMRQSAGVTPGGIQTAFTVANASNLSIFQFVRQYDLLG